MKEKLKKAGDVINRFVQSDYYILLVAILIFIGWFFNVWVAMLCILLAISVLPLFFFKSTKHIIPFLMYFTMIISENRHELEKYKYLLIPLVLLLLAGCVFSMIRFKRDWSVLSPKKIKGFHLSLLLLLIPFGLGGLGSPYESGLAVLLAFLLVLAIGLVYTFFVVTNTDDDRKQLMTYMIKTLFVSGILVTAQILTFYIRVSDSFDHFVETCVLQKWLQLGWAGPNNASPVLALTIPSTLYLCIKKNKLTPALVLLVLLQFCLIVCMGCRGTLLFLSLCLPFMVVYVYNRTENKKAFSLTLCLIFSAGVILIGRYGQDILRILSPMLNKGFDSSDRIESLYPEAIEAFRRWPIFGAGWDYKIGEIVGGGTNAYTPHWYHSTFYQVLANMGIVGVIFFVIFYYWRYRTLIPLLKDPRACCLIAGILIFDAYGMIDVNFFGPTFFLMLALISFTVDAGLDDGDCRAFNAKPFKNLCAYIERKRPTVEPADE